MSRMMERRRLAKQTNGESVAAAAPKTAGAAKGHYVTLVQTPKNTLDIIPNPATIAEFVQDNLDHLPTDILMKLNTPEAQAELAKIEGSGNRRYNVWGDDAVLAEMLDDLLSNGWTWVQPEEIGALTSAPILEAPDGRIYWHERYQVESAAEELILGRTVVCDGAPENKKPIEKVELSERDGNAVEPGALEGKKSAKTAAEPAAEPAPVEPAPELTAEPVPMGGGDNPYAGWQTENLIQSIETLTDNENFATTKPEQKAVEQMAEVLSARPVEQESLAEPKKAALKRAAAFLKKKTAADLAAALRDPFIAQYITTALWSSHDESTPSGGEPLDKNYGVEDIDPATLEQMVSDCEKFKTENWEMIQDNVKRAGHDFWLTRNGHGAGFWDGDWPENGDALTKASDAYGEFDLYVGDDGKIYSYPAAKVAALGGGTPPVNEDTGTVLEGDKSIPDGRDKVEDHTGVEHPKTDSPSKFASGAPPVDQDTSKVLEGDKSIEGQKDNEDNTGVTVPSTETPTKAASGAPPVDQDTSKVLEGDKSVAGQQDNDDNTGVKAPATETPTKVAAAPISTAKALKLTEEIIEELNALYMDAKPIVTANESRPVRDAVESIYHAMRALGEAQKVLQKQERQEQDEVKAQEAAAAKKKSSGLLSIANLSIAAAAEEKTQESRLSSAQERRAFRAAVIANTKLAADVASELADSIMRHSAAYKAAHAANKPEQMQTASGKIAALALQLGASSVEVVSGGGQSTGKLVKLVFASGNTKVASAETAIEVPTA